MSTFFTDLVTKVDTLCDGFILQKAAAVIGAITPVSTTLLIIYVGMYGIAMLRGTVQEPWMEGGMRLVKIGLIVGIGLSLGNYQQYVYNFLWHTPDQMANVLTGGANGSQVSALDQIYDKGMIVGDKAWQKMGLTEGIGGNLGYFAIAIVAYAATLLLSGYAAILIVMSKIALAVLLSIGPICIMLLMFQATQKFFESWLGLAMNFVFMTILVAVTVTFTQALVGAYLQDIVAADAIKLRDTIQLLFVGVLSAAILAQVPSLASALGGGVAISTMNVAGGAARGAANQFKRQPHYEKDSKTGKRDKVNYKSNIGMALSPATAGLRIARKLYQGSRSNKVSNG